MAEGDGMVEEEGGGGVVIEGIGDVRERTDGVMDVVVMGEKVINDGLLCSILHAHAMSGAPNADDLILRIMRDCDVSEILVARKKLFTYFSGVICSERNKPVLDIERLTTKKYVKDVVDQVVKVDRVTEVKMFCMPFDYQLKKFETESTRLTRVIEREISNEFDMKIDALEQRINEKNRALHDSIVESVNRSLQQKPSYSDVTGGARSKQAVQHGPGVGVGAGGGGGAQKEALLPLLRPRVDSTSGGNSSTSWGGSNQGSGQLLGVRGEERIRGRSPSLKRLRSSDGTPVGVQERSGSRPPRQQCVVGTSNNSALTTRKMRSPPADIFVWGVHPDTALQDIIADLADSGVLIQERDIEKKSRPEAFLVSYKISVKAEDLQKALDPSAWPLRVKVREFVHYARRNPRQQREQSAQQQVDQHGYQQGGHRGQQNGTWQHGARHSGQHGQHHGGQHSQQQQDQQPSVGNRDQGEISVATNRYALPNDNVLGGPHV